jgi:DNA polymerase elongation subunit (family B)
MLYVRGYEDGKRFQDQIEYQPYVFVNTPVESDFKSLDGVNVRKFYPGNMRDANEFIEKYKNVKGHSVFGIQSFEYQYINDNFPGEIEYDPDLISVVTLDIETDSEGGFPNIKTANKALTAITLRKNQRAITFGMQPYTPELDYVTYVQCNDERDMLMRFIDVWRSPDWLPDVLTGWNVEFFDMQYLINRIVRLFDEKTAKRLSTWERWEKKRNPNAKTEDDE